MEPERGAVASWERRNQHNDLKPNRKPVTETGFDDSGHETGFTETGFIETGLARHGETGFT